MLGSRSAVAHTRWPFPRALAWLAFLAPFFFASYGFATWVTAQRGAVGSVVFDWERAIPFVPWTIVPYWSIDVLYGVSLFFCVDRHELDTHAKRLLTAQLIAVGCFLTFPLRFTFERPASAGVAGWLFEVLGSFDKPYNQAPSLHIALLVIVWALVARKTTGLGRWAAQAWLALIGVSVLTTWQHHFVDVPTGALLGFACLWLGPLHRRSPLAHFAPKRERRRLALAARYALGAMLCALLATLAGGGALWLLWVTVALSLVALAYAALGADAFQKHEGRLSPAALALLLPYLVGAWLNARAWTGWQRRCDCIAEDVWIGPLPSHRSLRRDGIDAIVDLAAELPLDPAGRAYACVPMLDLVAADGATIGEAAAAIERLRARGRVLVCCALGLSRSASAVAGWLIATGRARDGEDAFAMIRRARPRIVLRGAHRRAVDSMPVVRTPA